MHSGFTACTISNNIYQYYIKYSVETFAMTAIDNI